MLRRVPRVLRVAVIVAVLVAAGASIAQSWLSATPGTAGYVQTAWGPLGPADRDLLVKVRLAGLWEAPSGQQAEQQATRTEVQDVGLKVHNEHVELDALVRETADQLGVLLPSRPSAEQLTWMNEMTALTGTQYDEVFVQRLRAAHGAVLPVIAEVRVGTRNELMRQFAATADEYVSRHIGYLESTGIVDYAALPEPPSPGLLSAERRPVDLILPGTVVLAALLAGAALLLAMRRPARPGAAPHPGTGGPAVDTTARAIAAIAVPPPRVPHPSESLPTAAGSAPPGPGSPPPDPRHPGPTSDDTGPFHARRSRVSETGPRHAARR